MAKTKINTDHLTGTEIGKFVGIATEYKLGAAPTLAYAAGVLVGINHHYHETYTLETTLTVRLGAIDAHYNYRGEVLTFGDNISDVTDGSE